MKNDEILKRLKAIGLNIYKQKLSMIFSNPFYCGIIANKMLDGKLIEGVHEKLISQQLFLEVNEIRKAAKGKYGVTHKKEVEHTPLKLFLKCDKCGQPVTGYIVKQKNLHYYKCRTIGCRSNKNANKVNQAFASFLSGYALPEHFIPAIQEVVYTMLDEHTASVQEQSELMKARYTEIQKKVDILDEKYYVENSIPAETYEKLKQKLVTEKEEIGRLMTDSTEGISNLKKCFDLVAMISRKLAPTWASSDLKTREKIQKLLFPDGIAYHFKNESFRTITVNKWFAAMPLLAKVQAMRKTDKAALLLPCPV